MKILNFVKNWSDNYYAEKLTVWNKTRIWWTIFLLILLVSYLLQIYVFYRSMNEFQNWDVPEGFWDYFPAENWKAIGYQTIVIVGTTIKVVSLQFRNKWALRFSDAGSSIAFFAFLGHYFWTLETFSIPCSSPLIGVLQIPANLILMFFMIWSLYKILSIIAITWETVREYPQCQTQS